MQLEGHRLNEYRLLYRLGNGGMGEVYYAQDERLSKKVAIRLIRSSGGTEGAGDEKTNRFQSIARAITQLDHPLIVPLLDYGETRIKGTAYLFLVTPFLQEGTLITWLQRQPETATLIPQDIIYLIKQAAGTLQHAHDHHIVHQDVRAANFFIRSRPDTPGRPDLVLSDFSLIQLYDSMSQYGSNSNLMTSEQAQPAFDQYALAVMAYQLLTGNPLLRSREDMPVEGNLPSPDTLNLELPGDIGVVLSHALAQRPERRFASMAAFANAFQIAVTQVLSSEGDSSDFTPYRIPIARPPVIHSSPPSNQTGQGLSNQQIVAANMAPSYTKNISITLSISPEEAQSGTVRTVTIPSGAQVPVTIPPGAQNGQSIGLDYLSEPTFDDNLPGTVVVTLAIAAPVVEHLYSATLVTNSKPFLADELSAARRESGVARRKSKPFLADELSAARRESGVARRKSKPIITSLPASGKLLLAKFLHWLEPASHKAILLGGLAVALIIMSSGLLLYSVIANGSSGNVVPQAGAASGIITSSSLPYPPGKGTLQLNDSLQNNTGGHAWDEVHDATHICQFINKTYVVQSINGSAPAACFAKDTSFSNFAFEAKMTFLTEGAGGLIFRGDSKDNKFYYFQVASTGMYRLYLYTGTPTGPNKSLIDMTYLPPPTFQIGLNQANLIAVVADGNAIDLYMNRQHLYTIHDTVFSQGQIGVAATSYSGSTKVIYSNARAWKI